MGTLPIDVRDFALALQSGEAAADYVEEFLRAANSDLRTFRHKPILKALKESPDGVSTDIFDGVEHKGVDLAEPKEVALAMQMRTAIVYHLPSREYRLASRAHRTALLERYTFVKSNP